MSTAVSQAWMHFTAVYSFAAVLIVAGFTLSWYDRQETRRRLRRGASRRANAGPHQPV